MNPLAVVARPRQTFTAAAAAPRVGAGAAIVAATGLVSAALGLLANALVRGGAPGFTVAAVLPLLFLGYWLLEGWMVDAAAGMLAQSSRRPTYLSTSAYAFPAWIAYALLSVLEAVGLRLGGPGTAIAGGLAWCTLPVLGWFVVLSVLAIRAVYDTTPLTALALALLPYAVLMAALLVLTVALGALHGAGVI